MNNQGAKMVLPDPCCGSSLQQGTKFLAMLSMVLSVIELIIFSFLLVTILFGSSPKPSSSAYIPPDPSNSQLNEEEPEESLIKLFIAFVLSILNLFLSILLLTVAEQKNLRLGFVWLKVTIFLFVVDIVFLVGSLVLDYAEITDIIINSSGIIYTIYELWVVYAFMTEIKTLKEADAAGSPTVDTTV